MCDTSVPETVPFGINVSTDYIGREAYLLFLLFFFGGKEFFMDEFNPLEAYVCVNFLNGITANITE